MQSPWACSARSSAAAPGMTGGRAGHSRWPPCSACSAGCWSGAGCASLMPILCH